MVGRLVRAAAGTDVVVAGNEVGAGLVGAFLAGKATNKPVVAIAHRNLTASLDVVGGWEKRAAELIYPHLDGVVCVSRRVVPTAVALGVSARRLRVIPNGTDPQRLAALASAPPPEWLPDGTIVMGLGSLEKQKGFDLLIEAHARVRADGQPHQLVIVGEGPERESLESLVARLGLSDSVHLPGFLRNPFPILARASLCCVPSRFEGSPLVLPEALGLGVPVIAANCVSAPSEVLAGDAYWDLVEGDSADALASAIARHLDQPQRLASKAQAGREDSDAYSVRARAWNYASLFEKVLAHRIP
jgi:glycosyltransferase involved in cell wall biosynthesis